MTEATDTHEGSSGSCPCCTGLFASAWQRHAYKDAYKDVHTANRPVASISNTDAGAEAIADRGESDRRTDRRGWLSSLLQGQPPAAPAPGASISRPISPSMSVPGAGRILHADNLSGITRRQVMAAALGLGAGVSGLILPRPSWADQSPTSFSADFWRVPRTLALRHSSGDAIRAVYWADGGLIKEGYESLSHFLRDRVTGESVYMDEAVLDIVYAVQGWLQIFGVPATIQINSGYRTPWRNARIEGAAKNSQHTKGRALDLRILGVNATQVGHFGRWLGRGGVGFYPGRNFTHLDTGRVRTWRG